jgi:uncharacterized protein (TIGR03000 family)
LQEVLEMYSVVLMMALSGTAEAPDCIFGRGCHCGCGCYSCGCGCGCGCFRCHGGCHCGCFRCHGCHCGYCGCYCHSYCHCGCYTCGHCGYSCGHCGYDCCCGGGVVPPPPGKQEQPPKKDKQEASATIIVSLPADATLTIDGNPTTSKTARRIFTSPVLPVGQDFVYTLRAEIVREGQPVALEQRVTVRGGMETPVQFAFPTGVAAQ